MRIKSLLLFLILLLSVSAVVLAKPQISLPQGTEYNLGTLEEGKIYEKSFLIKNIGDEELKVKVASTSCGCVKIVSPQEKITLSHNQAISPKYTFNTTGYKDKVVQYIYIESNDPETPILKVKLTTDVRQYSKRIIDRFLSFGTWTIIAGGLIDGINPCAFTALVFFISFLSVVGYRRRDLLILGATFILAVFITYILIGLGLFKVIQSLEVFNLLSRIVYLSIAILAIVLGMFSLYDWYIYKKNKDTQDIKLKLPSMIRAKIQKIIQGSSRNKGRTLAALILTVLASGFLISLLESVCTGQIYVPTITYVLNTPSLRRAALFYLVLYNFMFIVPLIIIFGFTAMGTGSQVFSGLTRKYLGEIKLLTAGLFFVLGILILAVK